jgi:indolepyruvate ferredoxin oxidoreductase beta subunit
MTHSFHPGTPIKIAVLAMGGQGGGVLADWIVDLAEHAGWWAQTTSVPGVAQRTGATIYYVELLPEAQADAAGRPPVLAMMPTPGDVDLVLAAELMEGGRAILRGLVTPDRTTLIASSHRSYAISEKSAPGDGSADPNQVLDAGRAAAKRFYCFDLQAIADEAGSVISASLFGAVAGSGALPFGREAFEATITRAGVGVDASLRAFQMGHDAAANAPAHPPAIAPAATRPGLPAAAASPRMQELLDAIRNDFPEPAHALLLAGVRRAADFQDIAYAREYLDRLRGMLALDRQFGGAEQAWALTVAAARQIAVAMTYNDVIRVADLKTRGARTERVRQEVRAGNDQIVLTTEYLHPRLEEVCGTLPAALGRRIAHSRLLAGTLGRIFRNGRFVDSASLHGFLTLYCLAGMRRFRRGTLRHHDEMAAMTQWLEQVDSIVRDDYGLAVEMVNCRRFVKGYSDTLARGAGKYARLSNAAKRLLGQPDAAARLRTLREAALADAQGSELDRLLALDERGALDTATPRPQVRPRAA